MDKPKLKYQIFDLTPEKFTELCHQLLKAELKLDKAYILDLSSDEALDIIGYKGLEKIAIHVKHKFKIDKSALVQELQASNHLLVHYHKFIFITSAQIDKNTVNELTTEKIFIIHQEKFIKLLDKHKEITQRYVNVIEKKNRLNRTWLITSFSAILISIISTLFNLAVDKIEKGESLTNRINNVEQALQNIKGLEKDLGNIKEDMIKTDLENKRILEEYEKIRGIEEIIKDKKEILNLILNYQPWYRKIFNFIGGLISGIAGSIIASIFWNKWKQKKSLKN